MHKAPIHPNHFHALMTFQKKWIQPDRTHIAATDVHSESKGCTACAMSAIASRTVQSKSHRPLRYQMYNCVV
jgi:hypothetical protein